MKIVALIPARKGSKRIKNKNSKKLDGIPLTYYSIRTARESKNIESVYVSSDSDKIGSIAIESSVGYVNRPAKYSTDKSTDLDVIKHFIKKIDCDMIVYLRPTTPFRDAKLVDHVISGFLKLLTCKNKPHSLRSVEEMPESAEKCFTIKAPAFLQPFWGSMSNTDKPNQQCTKTYNGNGYVDIILPRIVKKTGNLWGTTIVAYPTDPVIELDTQEQWKYAEWWIERHGDKI